MADLIAKGKLRAWGILNWPPALIAEAARLAAGQGAPTPCVAQLAYNVARRSPVEDSDMVEALRTSGASVIASFVLSGGALTDKYSRPDARGRMTGQLDDPRQQGALVAAPALRRLAERSGTTAAALGIAFALLNPNVASVLFGATSPDQVTENAEALRLLSTMSDNTMAELKRLWT
jgi:aryl-alcohol dehydrogenase-like predicted oxidoreductase